MLPPFLRIIINEPALLAEHVDAYSSLLVRDLHLWQAGVKRRLIFGVLIGSSLFLALLFSGVALMLWGATGSGHWLLIAVPVAPLVLSIVVALIESSKEKGRKPFRASKEQFCADMRVLKEGI